MCRLTLSVWRTIVPWNGPVLTRADYAHDWCYVTRRTEVIRNRRWTTRYCFTQQRAKISLSFFVFFFFFFFCFTSSTTYSSESQPPYTSTQHDQHQHNTNTIHNTHSQRTTCFSKRFLPLVCFAFISSPHYPTLNRLGPFDPAETTSISYPFSLRTFHLVRFFTTAITRLRFLVIWSIFDAITAVSTATSLTPHTINII